MNKPPATHPRLVMSLLEEHYYIISHRRPVVCRLWRMRPSPHDSARTNTFAVGLESPGRRYLYCVGEQESHARVLVRRIVENRLEPIHLGNVVEDFLWELENSPVTDPPDSQKPESSKR